VNISFKLQVRAGGRNCRQRHGVSVARADLFLISQRARSVAGAFPLKYRSRAVETL
jgi:hypothetical protein